MPEFTPQQINAIDITRLGTDACIVAGPGSGKTTVLVERYRQLVESGVAPRDILAITFTEKAAANMKDKMAKAFASEPEIRRQIEGAYISTVHGFCQRLLKENAIAARVDPQFAILDERQGQILRARCAVETLDAMLRERPEETGRLMESIEQADLAVPLVEVYEAVRSAGISADELAAQDVEFSAEPIWEFVDEYRRFPGRLTPRQSDYRDELVEWAAMARAAIRDGDWKALASPDFRFLKGKIKQDFVPEFERISVLGEELRGAAVAKLYARERGTLIEILRQFERRYGEEKQKVGVLDFSDLEHYAIRLLEGDAEVRRRVQGQFRQILMDEYQDTNGQQARLLNLLRRRGNFYAVGDINQSIFGFRYATPEVFRGHREEVESSGQHHVELFDNFRSRDEILRAVDAVFEDASGVERHELNARRDLPAKQTASIEVTAARAEDAGDAARVEAEWIASRILELQRSLTVSDKSRPAKFSDFAVLARKTSIIEPVAEAFDRFGVPYQVTRQIGFFESREIRDLTHLLRAIANPRDEVSLAVVLRSPFAGLSDEALLRMKHGRDNLAAALEGEVAGLDPVDAERLTAFQLNFTHWRSLADWIAVDRLLAQAMSDCGYRWEPGSAAGNNIEKLLGLARHARRDRSLAEFVHEIHLIREEDAREADAPFDEALDAVRVITAHASKGLEFPVVFIPGMQGRMAINLPALTFTTDGGLGTKWRNPFGGKAVSDWFRMRNKEAIRRRENDESDRLLYVAMTRAEEHLVLSYALGEDEKPLQWAAPVARVFRMDLLEPDEAARVVEAGSPGREFAAFVRTITRAPAAMRMEAAGAFSARIHEVPQPEPEGQNESSVTVTALTLFADCPRRYYLARYLGWETDGRKPSPASELGRQVHALLAGQDVPAPDLEALHLADTFDRGDLGRRMKKARRVEHEADVMFAMGDMVLRGQIDLWFEDRGGQIIVDYKTDDIAAGEAEERAKSYAMQLRYYAMAVEKIMGAPATEAWLHFLRPDAMVRVDLAHRHLDAARAVVEEMAAAQQSNSFPLKEGAHCTRCPFYRGKCPSGY